ncbi:hypothetical protein B0H14DRAFT_2377720, partial [Mycena olivaceomarginata]
CMKGTRVEIIRDIVEQLTRPPDTSLRIAMLTGPAGSGKSTIAKTISASLAEEKKSLAASFFFSRVYPERRDINYLTSTLAHQLAEYSVDFGRMLVKLLEDDKNGLISTEPIVQFQKLFVGSAVQCNLT